MGGVTENSILLVGYAMLGLDERGPAAAVPLPQLTSRRERVAPAPITWARAAVQEREWACPSTMVDRIVPAPTNADLDRVAARLGLRDEGAVVTVPFAQWVIEDRFAGPRPRWDAAGARFMPEVRPFESAKLRMLNGAHSALACLGLERGYRYVHEAIADPAIRPLVEQLMREEAAASLTPAPGQRLRDYADALLERFANPALPHRVAQIATDGSQKIGARWLEPIAANRAAGRASPATLAALAAWTRFARADHPASPDPSSDRFMAAWSQVGANGIADRLFGQDGLFGKWAIELEGRAALRGALTN